MGFLEDRDLTDVPSISEYFKGKCVFITGGSGFLGKVLIEKLLYSCSDLDRIYLLMRPKKGVEPQERLNKIYSAGCFDRLRQEKPDIFMSKVKAIPGDVMELGLALSDEDRALLIDHINVIFHVAASVRFDDTLPFATKLNLRGTREVIELSKEMKHLSALVHISTSYSNTNTDPVEERMYPPHADWRDTIEICENLDEHTVRVLTPKYLGELPNTYTFTKQLAEHVVYEERGRIPAVIIRPSIVISSYLEPVQGWIDNFNGPVGLLVASGKGIMRSIYSDPNLIADYIPVDVCVNTMITAAWARGTTRLSLTDDIPVYNCAAGKLYNVTYGEVVEMGRKLAIETPLNDALWRVGGNITTSKTVHYVKVLLLHLLPAVFVDLVLWAIGRKPMLVKLQRRIYIVNLALQYYILQQWTFANEKMLQLRNSVKAVDKDIFSQDIEGMDVENFYYQSYIGARKYLFNETEEDLIKARAHAKRMLFLDYFVKFIFYVYVASYIVQNDFFKFFWDRLWI